jgi:hypothetical protein
MAEICARTLQPPRAPWLDLSEVSSALTQDMLEKISGGILLCRTWRCSARCSR